MVHRRWLTVGLAGLLCGQWGCSSGSKDKCSGVQCLGGAVCDPADGTCKLAQDAGRDAGPTCNCSGATPVCNPATNTCVVCTATGGCNALQPVCDTTTASGRCVQCLANSDCPPLTPLCDTASNTCRLADGGVPLNDSCATAVALDLTSGSATVSGTTTGAAVLGKPGDGSPSCSGSALLYGPTVVYSLTLTAPRDVFASATPAANGVLQPVVYLRDANCASGALADELGCGSPSTLPPTLAVPDVAAGTYYLFVSGDNASSGDFSLTVSLGSPTPRPTNDDCPGAIALPFDAGLAVAHGSTFNATNSNSPTDEAPQCVPSARITGRDVVYSYQLPAVGKVDISATPSADGGAGYLPVVYVRAPGHCADGDAGYELDCEPQNIGDPAAISLLDQAPGTYFLWVDSALDSRGPFDLQVQFTGRPANDNCPGTALQFVAGVATAHGDTSAATNSGISPSCSTLAGSSGRDVVYSYTLTQAQDVAIEVAADPGSAYQPVIYVYAPASGCGTTATEVPGACVESDTGPANLYLANQAVGSYDLWVDTLGDNPGPFTATVTLLPPTPPAPNDKCSSPTTIVPPKTGYADTTITAKPDYSDTCVAAPPFANSPGPDVVYAIPTAAAGQLTVTVTPTADSFFQLQPGLFLRDSLADCTALDGTGSLGCSASAGAGAPATLVVPRLPAGTHYLIVDGVNGTAGPFLLDVSLDPEPAVAGNVTCADAGELILALDATQTGSSGTVSGETLDAGAHTSFTCSTDAGPNPSVVYAFATPDAGASYNARVTATSLNADTMAPVFALRARCSSTIQSDQIACAPVGAFQYATGIALGLKPSTDYSVWVGSVGIGPSLAGPFALEVDVAPVPAPNDKCPGAISLTANSSVPGTTLGAADDFNTTWYVQADGGTGCDSFSNPGAGADVVYAFTAVATGRATAVLSPEPTFQTELVVLDACRVNSCDQQAVGNGPGAPVSLEFSTVAGRTYYLVVDSELLSTPPPDPASRGGFTLGVSQ